jgi:hypothetical protein
VADGNPVPMPTSGPDVELPAGTRHAEISYS